MNSKEPSMTWPLTWSWRLQKNLMILDVVNDYMRRRLCLLLLKQMTWTVSQGKTVSIHIRLKFTSESRNGQFDPSIHQITVWKYWSHLTKNQIDCRPLGCSRKRCCSMKALSHSVLSAQQQQRHGSRGFYCCQNKIEYFVSWRILRKLWSQSLWDICHRNPAMAQDEWPSQHQTCHVSSGILRD